MYESLLMRTAVLAYDLATVILISFAAWLSAGPVFELLVDGGSVAFQSWPRFIGTGIGVLLWGAGRWVAGLVGAKAGRRLDRERPYWTVNSSRRPGAPRQGPGGA